MRPGEPLFSVSSGIPIAWLHAWATRYSRPHVARQPTKVGTLNAVHHTAKLLLRYLSLCQRCLCGSVADSNTECFK